jgi:hypothetical protein
VDNAIGGIKYLRYGLDKSGDDPRGALQVYYHGSVLKPGQRGPTSGPGTPDTLGYSDQALAKMEEIARRRGGSASPPGMGFKYGEPQYINPIYKENKSTIPPMQTASLYGGLTGDEEEQPDMPEETPEESPDIAGLTRPLDQSMQGEWMGAQDHELDNYVRNLVDEEFSHRGAV